MLGMAPLLCLGVACYVSPDLNLYGWRICFNLVYGTRTTDLQM